MPSNNRNIIFALFRNNTCVATALSDVPNSNNVVQLSLQFTDAPTTTIPITYSLRVGTDISTTWYINRSVSGITLGNTLISSYTIKEY